MKKLFLVSTILIVMCNASFAADGNVTSTHGKTLSAANGRYVLGQISDFRKDQYLLDTQTGRVWALTNDEKGASVFAPVFFGYGDSLFSIAPDGSTFKVGAEPQAPEKSQK